MTHFNFHTMSNGELHNLKQTRWEARTNLLYLCNHILGYDLVNKDVHWPTLGMLQKFPYPNKQQFVENDDLRSGYVKYTPLLPMIKLVGGRRNLILDFRGSFKTTVNAIAHSMQWLLNYPNAAILLIQSSAEKAEQYLKEIKEHFQYNNKLRNIFPEYCPQKKVSDWGTKGKFTVEARDGNRPELGSYHKEESIETAGIDKGLSGIHVDCIKFSDIVDPVNTKTIDSCLDVRKSYYLMENLLVAPTYWIDIEGTRYSYSDLYGYIIDAEEKLPKEQRRFKIYVRGCYKRQVPSGYGDEKFTPDELKFPLLKEPEKVTPQNPEGYVSRWPERFPEAELENKRLVAPFEFATQQLNDPRPGEEGMIPFPVTEGKNGLPVWVPTDKFKQNYPVAYYELGVDTAETDNRRSNYSAIVVGAWTGSGMCVVVDIIHGKFLPDALIDQIYEVYDKYKPRHIKIERTSFVRGFLTGLRREGEKRGVYLPVEEVPTENQLRKTERILKTLQPWYFGGELRFLENINHKKELLLELSRFPNYEYDDILDAICDLFQNKEYFGREIPKFDKNQAKYLYNKQVQATWDKYLGIDTPSELYIGDTGRNPSSYDKTGGL